MMTNQCSTCPNAQTATHANRQSASDQQCWSCQKRVSVCDSFCRSCDNVQPVCVLDHFQRIGLPAEYAVDVDELRKRYFQQQRLFHPDRFLARSPQERLFAQQQSAALNQAYEILKDPVLRAQYLLSLRSGVESGSGEQTISDPQILAEAMEWREALAEVETMQDLMSLREQAGLATDQLSAELTLAFQQKNDITAQKLALRLRYLHKFQQDVTARRLTMTE